MLDGLTQRLGIGQVTDVGWAKANTEAGCRTGYYVGWANTDLRVGQLIYVGWAKANTEAGCRTGYYVGWANTEAGCRTHDRCWMG